MSFENQTVYLPCAMQSVNTFQPVQDQLTLILWYSSWNTSGQPIYSIDFRNTDDYRRSSIQNQQQQQHQNAIHFISTEQFKNRILFEFDTCWLTESYQRNFWFNKAFNLSALNHATNQPANYHQLNHHYFDQFNHQINNTKNSFRAILKPICAFLKLEQVKQTDAGRYSCRMDFRRSRTLHTQLLLKVLGKDITFL